VVAPVFPFEQSSGPWLLSRRAGWAEQAPLLPFGDAPWW